MICTCCKKECFENEYPQIVFSDTKNTICEECSINYEQMNGTVTIREDLQNLYDIPIN